MISRLVRHEGSSWRVSMNNMVQCSLVEHDLPQRLECASRSLKSRCTPGSDLPQPRCLSARACNKRMHAGACMKPSVQVLRPQQRRSSHGQ